jgi:hypothetical protein
MSRSRACDGILIDAHVHLHRCFSLAESFDVAYRNMAHAARDLRFTGGFIGTLFLAEPPGANEFRDLAIRARAGADGSRVGAWTVETTADERSVFARGENDELLLIVAGRQLTTREGIEILALGTDDALADGRALDEALAEVRASDSLAVLPWGFGKWCGRRGRIVRRLLGASTFSDHLFVGDNGGRLGAWREPQMFSLARHQGLRTLPGTDVFPFSDEIRRLGTFGCAVRTPNRVSGADDVIRVLQDPTASLIAYGGPSPAHRFVRNQARIHVWRLLRAGGMTRG